MSQVLNGFARGSMGIVLALAVSACGNGNAGDSKAMGSIQAALTAGGSRHDVTGVNYKIVDANSSCTDTPIAETTSVLEEEELPGSVLSPGSGSHAGADGLFVLPPGEYRICATPLSEAGPSQACATAEGTVTVFPEATTEIVLVSQCKGDDNGGLDTVVALNDPPKIENLAIAPSKFITQCETATITATASDPDGDAISFTWTVISSPPGASPNLPNMGGVASFSTTTPGDYELRVAVADVNAGARSLSFPIHVSAVAFCPGTCGDGVCDASESCQTCAADCGPCGGTCSHDECTIGGPLNATCGTCVAAICQADPFCCNNSWDSICKGEVGSICGQTCGGSCGNGVCDASESCQSCAADCGACVVCGDGVCNGGESCQSCAPDCGACVVCGDGVCDASESCQSCAADCGACVVCGDGVCDASESCQSCAADCGACVVCGDGVCDASESCQSCAPDCGPCGGTCSHDECTIGGPLNASCGTCVAAICQADPFCCNNSWDSICKGEVGSVCGQTCPGS